MIYGSVCSGIEAATVAWRGLGWKPAWFSEIDPFCSALLAHHYPEIRNHGGFTTIGRDAGPIDLLCGGTACQAFSIAGLRRGLDDERGNLTLEFVKLASRLLPRWLVWENVPGVLSIDNGRAFGAFLGGWQNSGMSSPTEFLTLSTSEFRNGAVACSLSDVLETGDIPRRYYLSAKACAGILRRAEKRGKQLPVALLSALRAVISQTRHALSTRDVKTERSEIS